MKRFLLLALFACFAGIGTFAQNPPGGYGSSSGSGPSSATSTLSPNCSSAVLPCIQIPAAGGCFQGTNTTSANPTITFQSGFPPTSGSGSVQVGQLAWVQLEQGGGPCGTSTTNSNAFTEANYCGAARSGGGVPGTVASINPGVSITLSGTCGITQSGSNAWFFFVPNIYSQLRLACASGGTVHIAAGHYGLDNTANGTAPGCGSLGSGGAVVAGEGNDVTILHTPPWYNHEGDLGTVINGVLRDISLDGGWTQLSVAVGRGTPIYGGCGSSGFSVRGYNYGASATAETFYPFLGINGVLSNCTLSNGLIIGGNRGIAYNGRLYLSNMNITTNSWVIAAYNGGGNGTLTIVNSYLEGHGANAAAEGTAVIQFPDLALSSTNDTIAISNSDLCATGNNFAISDSETSGEIRLSNVRINSNPGCTPGTNASGVNIASGVTLRLHQTSITAAGTGNTLSNAGIYVDGCGNTLSGGAGYAGAGSIFGSCSVTGTLQTAGNIGLTSGFGTSTVGTVSGNTRREQWTITYAGTLLASETITITFPAQFISTPLCTLTDVGGTNAFPTQIANGTISATSAAFNLTFAAAPTPGNTEIYQLNCDLP